MGLLQNRLLVTIAASQDGNAKQIADIITNGDASGLGVSDNLNQLLADVIIKAEKTGDVLQAIEDLWYAVGQLQQAAHALKNEFISP